MEGTWVLVLLVVVMLLGSYAAGSIPLNVPMSEEKLRLVSMLGAGLLVGTALTVILPEGVRALQSAPPAPALSTPSAHPACPEPRDLHSVIGLSLVLGFVFMLLVEQVSMRGGRGGGAGEARGLTATLGLVVHAAADGVALGAAATTAQADVELIVFVAIMLHKAPAAFGLVTFLLHAGLDRGRIRRHLAVFALAAPAATLATYFGIGQESKDTLSDYNATGIAMLFSAGTFLYVATVHVLPELTHAHAHSAHALLPQSEGAKPRGGGALSGVELVLLALSALAPSLLTLGHHH